MTVALKLIESLTERYSHAVVAFLGDDGYPMSVATGFAVDHVRIASRMVENSSR